jgi:hypothetical protein
VGYEISPQYVRIAEQRLAEEEQLRRLREEGLVAQRQYLLPGLDAPLTLDPYDERDVSAPPRARRNGRARSSRAGRAARVEDSTLPSRTP